LTNDALIGRICESVTLPVNVMVMDAVPSNDRLSELGVSRISYGLIPYIRAMSTLQQEQRGFFPRPDRDIGGRAILAALHLQRFASIGSPISHSSILFRLVRVTIESSRSPSVIEMGRPKP
jgi:hypothetical protein